MTKTNHRDPAIGGYDLVFFVLIKNNYSIRENNSYCVKPTLSYHVDQLGQRKAESDIGRLAVIERRPGVHVVAF